MSFYLINKDSGITSHDVVNKLKKITNASKAGHAGTLDPFATGLMIIATNSDTKLLDRFLKKTKVYEGEFTFGVETNTLDIDGKVIKKIENVNINEYEIEKIINKNFIGIINQIPPQFSSIKINGKKSYENARNNKFTILKPVKRTIYSFKIKKISNDKLYFKIDVSSGTYIRSIARDIGNVTKLPVIVSKLNRIKIDFFSITESNKINDKILNPISRKKMTNIEELKVLKTDMKKILEGKVFISKLLNNKDEFISICENDEVLMKKIGLNKFFINKRLK